jgi:hypothetical protein
MSAAGAPPVWVWILIEILGPLVAVGVGVAAWWTPAWRKRRDQTAARAARTDAAANAVLGKARDPNTGFPGTAGLVADVQSLHRTLGVMNGGGSVVDMLESLNDRLERLEKR